MSGPAMVLTVLLTDLNAECSFFHTHATLHLLHHCHMLWHADVIASICNAIATIMTKDISFAVCRLSE